MEPLSGCCLKRLRAIFRIRVRFFLGGGVILPVSIGVFAEIDIEHPVQLVLDGPVSPRDLKHALGRQDG